MVTSSPFSWLEQQLPSLERLRPPPWLQHEVLHRLILLVNHVLLAEPQATARLARQKGRQLQLSWRELRVRLLLTPAGLFELLPDGAAIAQPDLTLTLTQTSPLDMVRSLALGEKPAVHIEGDVQLAADINWLADHVRWDVQEDLSRLLGDAPAHQLVQLAGQLHRNLRAWLARRGPAQATGGAT